MKYLRFDSIPRINIEPIDKSHRLHLYGFQKILEEHLKEVRITIIKIANDIDLTLNELDDVPMTLYSEFEKQALNNDVTSFFNYWDSYGTARLLLNISATIKNHNPGLPNTDNKLVIEYRYSLKNYPLTLDELPSYPLDGLYSEIMVETGCGGTGSNGIEEVGGTSDKLEDVLFFFFSSIDVIKRLI